MRIKEFLKKYWQNYPIRNILLLSKGKGNKKSYKKNLKNMHTILDNWIYYSIDNKEEQTKKIKKI